MIRFIAMILVIAAALVAPTAATAQDPASVPDQPTVIEVPGMPVKFFTNGHNLDGGQVAEMCLPKCAPQEMAQYVTPQGLVDLDGMMVVGLDRLMGFRIPAGYSARLFPWGDPIDVEVANVDQVFNNHVFRKAIIFNGRLPEDVRGEPALASIPLLCDDSSHCSAQEAFSGVGLANSLDPKDYSLRESAACATYKLEDNQVIQYVNAAGEAVITGGHMTLTGQCGLVWISGPLVSDS